MTRVDVRGRLLADPAGVVSIEPRQAPGQLEESLAGPVAPRSPIHLRLTGIDVAGVAALPQARRDDTGVQAWAEVVAELGPDGSARVERAGPLTGLRDFWTPGPSGVLDADIDAPPGEPAWGVAEQPLIDDGTVLSRKILRTRRGGRALVLVTTAPDEVERRLRPVYGAHLHVEPSAWTAEQYRGAGDMLGRHHDEWQVIVLGDQVDGRGRLVVVAFTVDTPPALSRWLATQPRGLVDHRPWIRRLTFAG
ncbi:hypothetical protein [Actinoplanes sp. URMC 104]|uniref:hypothetical protein n=1 Tax=Actinoplanes sp. URMC 104 TaxID=3423409 RepID=UPI003F1C7F5B